MKTHRFLFSLLLLALPLSTLAQSLPVASPESVGMSAERLERVGTAIEHGISSGEMPGAVISIARKGKLVYFEAFGYLDKERDIPMPKDAIFSIASLTKPIVAVGALMLHERGELLLNEPVGHYLPELEGMRVAIDYNPANTEAALRQPTIRDLMRHTSGFTNSSQGNTELHQQYPSGAWPYRLTGPELVTELSMLPLHHQPGTTWDYSYGFDILGVIIEDISQQSHGQFLRDSIFEPLGMRDTFFKIPSGKVSRQAVPLANDVITGAPQTQRDQQNLTIECGGGCLASTAEDYLIFSQMLLNKGILNDERLLGPKTVEHMISDHADPAIDLTRLHSYPTMPDDGYGFGLGVSVRRETGLGGTMGSPGEFHWYGSTGTIFRVDPKEELVVVFMAHTPGEIRRFNRQLIPALVYQAILD
jgi:CubicO group peptidase (beta-lactamase class C family)